MIGRFPFERCKERIRWGEAERNDCGFVDNYKRDFRAALKFEARGQLDFAWSCYDSLLKDDYRSTDCHNVTERFSFRFFSPLQGIVFENNERLEWDFKQMRISNFGGYCQEIELASRQGRELAVNGKPEHKGPITPQEPKEKVSLGSETHAHHTMPPFTTLDKCLQALPGTIIGLSVGSIVGAAAGIALNAPLLGSTIGLALGSVVGGGVGLARFQSQYN